MTRLSDLEIGSIILIRSFDGDDTIKRYRVLAIDKSLPHPAANYSRWNYILSEYDETSPEKIGPITRLTENEVVKLGVFDGE